jgi:peptidoglycan/LPS O-acetylase OafA/YrhL
LGEIGGYNVYNNLEQKRDVTIDIFRAIAMIWVIFVHSLFWTGVFTTKIEYIVKSLFLIEMPLFFFLAGASNYMSKRKSILNFYFTRLQRILIPYWIYAGICILLTYIISVLNGSKIIDSLIMKWLIPMERQDVPLEILTWALWFIPVYLLIIMTFPFLRMYFDKQKNKFLKIMPLFVLAVCLFFMDVYKISGTTFFYYTRMLVFYCFWIYLGMFYNVLKENININKLKKAVFFIACVFVSILLVLTPYYSIDMQINKFPPNFLFLIYTLGFLSLMYYCSNHIVKIIKFLCKNIIIDWILKQYINSGYTIYLFHPLAMLLIKWSIEFLHIGNFMANHNYIKFFVYIILAIPLGAVLGKLFSWTEKVKIS